MDETVDDPDAFIESAATIFVEPNHVRDIAKLFGLFEAGEFPVPTQATGVLLAASQFVTDVLDLIEAAVALIGEGVVPEENRANAVELAGQLSVVDFAERAKCVTDKTGMLDGVCHSGHLFL